MKREEKVFSCIFLLYLGLVPFQKAHSARKMAQNWYARANPGILRNICASSIFFQHDLFLNSNHKKGPQASGCDKSLRCFSLQKWITAYTCADLSQDLCMRGRRSLKSQDRVAAPITQSNRGKDLADCPDMWTQKGHKITGEFPKKDYKDSEWSRGKDVG